MEHCKVDMQVVNSRVEEINGAVFDILTFRCPICGETVEKQYQRQAE